MLEEIHESKKGTQNTIEQLVIDLYNINAIEFGSFTLKSGITSPIYIDLRKAISYPHILKNLCNEMSIFIKKISCDAIAGVPYTGLPIATTISLLSDIPMIMPRKEIKDHGTKRPVEGVYTKGNTICIVEDLVTKGTSTLEIATILKNNELSVKDVVVFLDRQQGAQEILKEEKINLHAAITMNDLLETLKVYKIITTEKYTEVKNYLMP